MGVLYVSEHKIVHGWLLFHILLKWWSNACWLLVGYFVDLVVKVVASTGWLYRGTYNIREVVVAIGIKVKKVVGIEIEIEIDIEVEIEVEIGTNVKVEIGIMIGFEKSELTWMCWVVWVESPHWICYENWDPSSSMVCIPWILGTSMVTLSRCVSRWIVMINAPLLLGPSSTCSLFNGCSKISSLVDLVFEYYPFLFIFENDDSILMGIHLALIFFPLCSFFLLSSSIIPWHWLYLILYGHFTSKYTEFSWVHHINILLVVTTNYIELS